MHAPKLHAREPRDPVAIRRRKAGDRWEKAMSYKAHMYGGRESSGGIVLTKRSNAGQGGPKGIVEGRPLAKETVRNRHPHRTPCRILRTNPGCVAGAKGLMLRRVTPRWEPCALVARARVCAGGSG